jgi:hypothetical protein
MRRDLRQAALLAAVVADLKVGVLGAPNPRPHAPGPASFFHLTSRLTGSARWPDSPGKPHFIEQQAGESLGHPGTAKDRPAWPRLRSGPTWDRVQPARKKARRLVASGLRGEAVASAVLLVLQPCFWSKNCSSSVEPFSAAVEASRSMVVVTASK